MGCFHLKKKCMSEAVKILVRRLYDLVPTAEEEQDFTILGATLFIYFIQNPVSPSRIRKKSTIRPTAPIVHNIHIFLSSTNLSSATVSQNKALCNNAGLHCSCSQAVNSIRELIWLKKILQQMPCCFLKLGTFANPIQNHPQHSWGNSSSTRFGSLCCIKKLHTEWAWMSLSIQAQRQSLASRLPHVSCVLVGCCRQQKVPAGEKSSAKCPATAGLPSQDNFIQWSLTQFHPEKNVHYSASKTRCYLEYSANAVIRISKSDGCYFM